MIGPVSASSLSRTSLYTVATASRTADYDTASIVICDPGEIASASFHLNHCRFSRLGFAASSFVLPAVHRRKSIAHHEYMYVSAAETSLRDRVATMYNKVGTVHNGDRVEVLERQRRFLRVRTDKGQEGWIEERSLVPQEVLRRLPEAGAGR